MERYGFPYCTNKKRDSLRVPGQPGLEGDSIENKNKQNSMGWKGVPVGEAFAMPV